MAWGLPTDHVKNAEQHLVSELQDEGWAVARPSDDAGVLTFPLGHDGVPGFFTLRVKQDAEGRALILAATGWAVTEGELAQVRRFAGQFVSK